MKCIPLIAYHNDLLTVLDPCPFEAYLLRKCLLDLMMFYYPTVRPFHFASLAREIASEAVAADLPWAPLREKLVQLGSAASLPGRYMEDVLGFAFDVGRAHPAEWVHYARAYVYVPREKTFVNIAHGDRYSEVCFNGMWDEIRPDDALTNMVDHFRSNNLILEVDVVTSQNSPWPSIEVGLNGAVLHLTKEALQNHQ